MFAISTDIFVGEMIWYLDFALKYSGKILEGGWWNKMRKLVVVEAGQKHLKSSIIKSWQKNRALTYACTQSSIILKVIILKGLKLILYSF